MRSSKYDKLLDSLMPKMKMKIRIRLGSFLLCYKAFCDMNKRKSKPLRPYEYVVGLVDKLFRIPLQLVPRYLLSPWLCLSL